MDIGRKIYFEKSTGNVLQDCGERSGSVIATTQDQDFQAYTALQPYQQNAVGVIQCDYGYNADNFSKYPFHIDVTKDPVDETAIIFDLTPNQQVEVQLQVTQEQRISELEAQNAAMLLALVNGGLM